jgi:hypothetical protein
VSLEELLVHVSTIPKIDLKPGEVDSNGSVMETNHLVARFSLILAAWLAAALLRPTFAEACDRLPDLPDADVAFAYPPLPDLPGADIPVGACIVIYHDHIEVDGQPYALDGRPIDVPFDDLDRITVYFDAPPDTGVFVFTDGLWTQTLAPSPTGELLEFDVYPSTASRAEPEMFGFEFPVPGQRAPTVPTVVIRPISPNPGPS